MPMMSSSLRPDYRETLQDVIAGERRLSVLVDTPRAFEAATKMLEETTRQTDRPFASVKIEANDSIETFGRRLYQALGLPGGNAEKVDWSVINRTPVCLALEIQPGVKFNIMDHHDIASELNHLQETRMLQLMVYMEDRKGVGRTAPFLDSTMFFPERG